MSTSIFVIYDGIQNSVFASQVLSFITSTLEKTQSTGVLISFEKKPLPSKVITQLIPKNLTLNVIVCKKFPFIGKPSLWYAARQLKSIVNNYNHYSLYARGPLAGFICLRAKNKQCTSLTIQARGLLAEEYGYTHQQEKTFSSDYSIGIEKNNF